MQMSNLPITKWVILFTQVDFFFPRGRLIAGFLYISRSSRTFQYDYGTVYMYWLWEWVLDGGDRVCHSVIYEL